MVSKLKLRGYSWTLVSIAGSLLIAPAAIASGPVCADLSSCVALRDSLSSKLTSVEAEIQKLSPGACPLSGSGFDSLYDRLVKLGNFNVTFNGSNTAIMSFARSTFDNRPEFHYICTNIGCNQLVDPIKQFTQGSSGVISFEDADFFGDANLQVEVNCANSKVRATVYGAIGVFDLPQ